MTAAALIAIAYALVVVAALGLGRAAKAGDRQLGIDEGRQQ